MHIAHIRLEGDASKSNKRALQRGIVGCIVSAFQKTLKFKALFSNQMGKISTASFTKIKRSPLYTDETHFQLA